ncbi:hypothetical protein RJD18_28200, partial [Pseudomonas sp. HTZ1]|nr:hypothetical protein [Pseudomonas sp. HTZ1]
PSPNCSSSSLGILGRSRKGFFLVGIHAPLTHVMPEHKISDTLGLPAILTSGYQLDPSQVTPPVTYLFKPWSIDELAEAINQALSSASVPPALPASSDRNAL